MTVVVSFVRSGGIGGGAQGIAGVRAQERIAVGATTTTTTLSGETVIIGNGEASMIAVAWGSAPDAAATAENGSVTSAGYPIAAGGVGIPFSVPTGSKINAKAVT